ncbi:MAG: recombination factor protein RarA, partial [Gemmatimonadaceae bacterium]
EGSLPLAEMLVYLANAPKSNSSYRALSAAMDVARDTPGEGPPMNVRNAPTELMRDLGYHAGYKYAHDSPDAYIPQEYLPEKLRGSVFDEPGPFGFERDTAKRLAGGEDLKKKGPA